MPIKTLMRTEIQRRDVGWDPATATLTVGNRSTVLTCEPGDNECLLRTYLALVAEQREVRLDRSVALRRDDVAVLAELLDLDDEGLEARLRRLLRLSEQEAADLTQRLRRQRVIAAAMGVGMLAAVPASGAVAAATEGDGAVSPTPLVPVVATDDMPVVPAVDAPVVVEVTPKAAPAEAAPQPAPQPVEAAAEPAPEPAPQPAPEPETEVGYSVRYERDPNFVPPEGVDIGDAMFIERDAPPAEG